MSERQMTEEEFEDLELARMFDDGNPNTQEPRQVAPIKQFD